MTARRGHYARSAAHIEDVPFSHTTDSQTPVICGKTQSSRDKYVPDQEQHPQPLSKTCKYCCFISLFNIRELSCSLMVSLGLPRDSGRHEHLTSHPRPGSAHARPGGAGAGRRVHGRRPRPARAAQPGPPDLCWPRGLMLMTTVPSSPPPLAGDPVSGPSVPPGCASSPGCCSSSPWG